MAQVKQPTPYVFRRVIPNDFPLLKRWLSTPEVRRWWGDPDYELSLLEQDLDGQDVCMLIVAFETTEFAYIQDYDVGASPEPHYQDLPPGSRSIDVLIGEPSMLGAGHGPAFLRMRALQLLQSGVPVVAIDPMLENVRARKAYQTAGFVESEPVQIEEGFVVPMFFDIAKV